MSAVNRYPTGVEKLSMQRHESGAYALIDLRPFMPIDWQQQIINLVEDKAYPVPVTPSTTSLRASGDDGAYKLHTVDGVTVKKNLPWLFSLMQGAEVSYAVGAAVGNVVTTPDATDDGDRIAVIFNVLLGGRDDAYESHVDHNGATLDLFVTSHEPGQGGELVMSLDPTSRGLFDPTASTSVVIHPEAGFAAIFDGTNKPHYVAPPLPGVLRTTVIVEYYTRSAGADTRPPDLDAAIGLTREYSRDQQ